MRRFLFGILLAPALAACQSDAPEGERQAFTDGHFSIDVPDGWHSEYERGTVVLVGAETTAHNTIAIRSVARTGEWVAERTPDLVVPATEKSLAALPGAGPVTPRGAVHVGALEGAAFEVVYQPDVGGGARYERRHVVLVGAHRVFHVVHTAPEGSLDRSAAAFEAAVASLREEGV